MRLEFKVNKPAELVFEHLSDPKKFVVVHPVITKMEAANGNSYLVFETLKLGPIPLSFTYPASVESHKNELTVTMRAVVMKLTRIEMRYRISQKADHTLVEEDIEFKSPFPLKGLMKKVFRKQHEKLFRNIESKIVTGA